MTHPHRGDGSGFGPMLILVGLAALAIAGAYLIYWAVAEDSTDRRYEVNTGTQQYQAALISQQRDRVQAWHIATDPGQKTQLATTFCQVQTELANPPADLTNAAADLGC